MCQFPNNYRNSLNCGNKKRDRRFSSSDHGIHFVRHGIRAAFHHEQSRVIRENRNRYRQRSIIRRKRLAIHGERRNFHRELTRLRHIAAETPESRSPIFFKTSQSFARFTQPDCNTQRTDLKWQAALGKAIGFANVLKLEPRTAQGS
ncbi:hypothetical protein ACQ4M3_14120 [Leptolyngbya sp. AN03gr2]|uniref:hypothetical protein n=1 Tax=unclassified Leptolyngbya TaxID=2650499 RepID=UPI003D31F393